MEEMRHDKCTTPQEILSEAEGLVRSEKIRRNPDQVQTLPWKVITIISGKKRSEPKRAKSRTKPKISVRGYKKCHGK